MAELEGPKGRTGTRRPLSRLKPLYMKLIVHLLRLLGFKIATVSEALNAPSGRYACLTFDGADRDIYHSLEPTLTKMAVPASVFVATRDLTRQLQQGPGRDNPHTMSWQHLRTLTKRGWEVGTIGQDAVDLTQRSVSDQRKLITRARDVLGKNLGIKPNVFAYPFGAYDATTLSVVKEEGFKAALTLKRGVNNGEPEALHLRRLSLTANLFKDTFTIFRTLR